MQFLNFEKKTTGHTYWSCLIRYVNFNWIWQALLKIKSVHHIVHRWTGRQTDEQGETNVTPFQLHWSRGINSSTTHSNHDGQAATTTTRHNDFLPCDQWQHSCHYINPSLRWSAAKLLLICAVSKWDHNCLICGYIDNSEPEWGTTCRLFNMQIYAAPKRGKTNSGLPMGTATGWPILPQSIRHHVWCFQLHRYSKSKVSM